MGVIVTAVCLELLIRVFGVGYLLYQRGFHGSAKNDTSVYKILCLGDSFTLGVGAGKYEGYPAQLENMLKEVKSQKRFDVINEGIGGQNSSELLYFLDRNLDKYKPNMVVLMIGINDGHNTHLDNWALGQRGLYTKLFFWITGLRIYKLCNFARLSIEKLHNKQEFKPEVDLSVRNIGKDSSGIAYRSSSLNSTEQETNSILNEVRGLFKNGQNEKAQSLLIGISNKENIWECLNIAEEYNVYETEEYIIKKIMSTGDKDEWLSFTLGKIYLVQNKFDDAKRVFKSILENNPSNNYIRFDLAGVYMSQKRYHDAEELLKDAVKIQGKSPRAKRMLFDCYRALGRKAQADNMQEESDFYNKITDLNFSAIKNKILVRNIRLIVMNYPQRQCISENLMQGVTVIDNMNSFSRCSVLEKAKLFSADSLHCNAGGYKVIARNLFNYILDRSDF